MKNLFLTILLLTAASAAQAGSITIHIDSLKVDAPAFRQGPTTIGPMNKETTTYYDVSGAAFLTSLIRDGVPDATYGGADFFWAALVNGTPFSDAIRLTFTGTVTVDGSVANVTFGGVIGYSDKGMAWKLPPAAFTVQATDGNLIALSFITNKPGLDRGASQFSTIDLQIIGHVVAPITTTATPEPMTLTLVGLGLLLGARRLKNKGDQAEKEV